MERGKRTRWSGFISNLAQGWLGGVGAYLELKRERDWGGPVSSLILPHGMLIRVGGQLKLETGRGDWDAAVLPPTLSQSALGGHIGISTGGRGEVHWAGIY
jgi:hypothetical protein